MSNQPNQATDIGRIPLWNVLRKHGVSQDIAIQIISEAAEVPPLPTIAGAQEELDWLLIARAAGEHGVRYRTNRALCAFFRDIGAALPSKQRGEQP